MVNDPKWAPGSKQYVKRIGARVATGQNAEAEVSLSPDLDQDKQRQLEDFGISWGSFDVDLIKPSTQDRARHRFRGLLPELVWNTAALEGNTFTLPEVRTLLDGVTVGGRRTDDENQILALSAAYRRLDEMVEGGTFAWSKGVSDELHGLVAVHEAIDAGSFRGEKRTTGGGNVRLARGGMVEGTPHGEGGEFLRAHFERLVGHLEEIDDPRRRALVYFASATRRQFYFDGNKRAARLMMAGGLMSSGYDTVNVPFARKLEFNNALDEMFTTDDATSLLWFLGTCTWD